MEFRILGPLEVVDDGRVLPVPTGTQRTLLALMIVNANRVLAPDVIAEAVWGADLPASGPKALAFHVSRLRDALAPERRPGSAAGGLVTEAGGYVLRVDPEAIDAARFERLAREGHARLVDDPAAARAELAEALGLWRGDPLLDVAYAEFAQAEIRRLDELRLGALEDRLDAEIALGAHATAIADLEALLEANPLRERVRALLMLALYRAGRQAEALRVAGAGRRLLSEELGIDPSPEVAQLESRILTQDPVLAAPPARSAVRRARNPYKGLRSFGEADSADFFGREDLRGRLLDRLEAVVHDGRLLAVVGPSGSGKSSVVRAGLVPALRAGALAEDRPWQIATMLPGVAPFRELAAALAASGRPVPASATARADETGDIATLVGEARDAEAGRILLVIDQLEELFVRVDEETATRFLRGLVAALAAPGSPLAVVVTLRADFLQVPLALPGFGELIRGGVELVTPMTRVELERAIARPAEGVGIEVEAGLVVEIVSDVEHRPGVLPLLQFALTELFERSDGRRLTRDGYAAIGGAIGALGRRADEAWRSLDAEEREIARHVLLDLVDLAESGVATGRRVPRAELESLAAGGDDGRVGAVLDDLGHGGLLTFDLDPVTGAPTVEIAHEALLVHWSRLADWIDDLRDDLRLRRRLADATDEWEASGRSPGYLAGGTKLERFEAWAHGTRLHLTAGEQAYLAASAGERTRLRRRVRLVRSSIAAVVVIAFVLTGGLWAAVAGRAQAEQEQAAIASARELSVASIGASGDVRLLLALEAADATVGRGYVVEEAYDALQWALQDARVPFPAAGLPVGVRAAPDGPRGAFLLSPGELMRLASDAARRTLSPDECRAYLHADACPPVRPPAGDAALGVRTVNGVVPAESLAVGAMVGTTVRVLSELPTDVSPLLASVERSGITIRWTAGADGDLLAAADSSALPDVAIVARPSSAGTAARRGLLVDLAGRADFAAAGDAAGPYLMGLGRRSPATADDPSGQYGVPIAASVEGLLWYPVAAFAKAGYEAPSTAAELDELVRRLREDGRVPWCFGVDALSPTETAAAAWVEALYLEDQGVTAYDRWAAGETPFETPAMHAAFEAFGRRLIGPGNVFRDLDSALLTPERIAALPMVATDPPGCWLYRGSSADVRGLAPRAASVPFPGEAASRPLLGRVYEVVALRDRPEVRRLVQALAGAEFATGLSRSGCDAGIFALQGLMPAGCASGGVAGTLRAAIAGATFRARAVDTLPGDVGPAFESDVAEYLRSSSITGVDSSSRGFSADGAWDEVRAGGWP